MTIPIWGIDFRSKRTSGGPFLDPKWHLVLWTFSFVEPRYAFVESKFASVEPSFERILMKKLQNLDVNTWFLFSPDAVVGSSALLFRDESFFNHGWKFLSRVLTPSGFPDFLEIPGSVGGVNENKFYEVHCWGKCPKVRKVCPKLSLQEF